MNDIMAAVGGVNTAISICRRRHVPVLFVQEVVSTTTVLPPYLTRCGGGIASHVCVEATALHGFLLG